MSRLILHLLGLKCLVEQNHINFGGSGVVIYKTPEDSVKSGVKIGGYFFKGYKGYFNNPDVYIAIFAYPYDVPTDERIVVIAEDGAGNSKEIGFSYRLKDVKYRKASLILVMTSLKKSCSTLGGRFKSR